MSLYYLVDTDWAIHYLNGQPEIAKRLGQLQPEGIGPSQLPPHGENRAARRGSVQGFRKGTRPLTSGQESGG